MEECAKCGLQFDPTETEHEVAGEALSEAAGVDYGTLLCMDCVETTRDDTKGRVEELEIDLVDYVEARDEELEAGDPLAEVKHLTNTIEHTRKELAEAEALWDRLQKETW